VKTSGWVVDEEKPVYIRGTGMCWHGEDRGTMIKFSVPNEANGGDIEAPGTIHFGGIYNLTLYPTSGNLDEVPWTASRIDTWRGSTSTKRRGTASTSRAPETHETSGGGQPP